MRHLLTLPICHAHQVLHPCRPCEKAEARNQVKNFIAIVWLLVCTVFITGVVWYAAGGR
ncbi:hypothetical protein CCUG60885_04205 [Mycobacteroides salmoniphilum]|uniref:Uncharacterized protein n=1 Tax=Mycobacteroides salmoniphilum TaxID=404941 RepID=A0A4R8SC11_9MYCO|nr:hypothetical protein CCUG60885_04205 [Mycobacteroides salmoniphilum]TEA07321.1 hypothetical protein CCUG60883_01354 [Mycobacteroides salmoniphilum]